MKVIAKKIVNPHSIIQNRAVPVKGHCQVSFRNPKTGKLLKTKSYRISEKGWEDPLEKGMATHSSILAWRISWTEDPGGLQSMGLQRVLDTTDQLTLASAIQSNHRVTRFERFHLYVRGSKII